MSDDEELVFIRGPDERIITLIGGFEVRVRATAYADDGRDVASSGHAWGTRNSFVDPVRIPSELVLTIDGPYPSDTSRA
jgi:hypothetical protein